MAHNSTSVHHILAQEVLKRWQNWAGDWEYVSIKEFVKTIVSREVCKERRVDFLDPGAHSIYRVARAEGTLGGNLNSEWGGGPGGSVTSLACGCPLLYEIWINLSLGMKNSSEKALWKWLIYLSGMRQGGARVGNMEEFWKVEIVLKGVDIFNMFFLAKSTELEFNLNNMNTLNAITVYVYYFLNTSSSGFLWQ